MITVKVSPKYQIVIPRAVRRRMKIKPGQRLQVIDEKDRLEFVPLKSPKELRGFLKGIDTVIKREKDRL